MTTSVRSLARIQRLERQLADGVPAPAARALRRCEHVAGAAPATAVSAPVDLVDRADQTRLPRRAPPAPPRSADAPLSAELGPPPAAAATPGTRAGRPPVGNLSAAPAAPPALPRMSRCRAGRRPTRRRERRRSPQPTGTTVRPTLARHGASRVLAGDARRVGRWERHPGASERHPSHEVRAASVRRGAGAVGPCWHRGHRRAHRRRRWCGSVRPGWWCAGWRRIDGCAGVDVRAPCAERGRRSATIPRPR